jgi:hypothetical protein
MMIKKHIITGIALFLLTAIGSAAIMSLRPQKLSPGARLAYSESASLPQVTGKVVRALGFADELVPVSDPRIASKLNRALKKHSYENLQTTILHHKAERWFPVIEPILAEYGIPQDFKYIPLVESGLKEGTSRRGASGYWQFMPGTARSYGLTVNRQVDERQNMRKSTIAACKYIRELYAELKSWTLAAAAYNLGDTRLKYQMASQKQQNYYKMRLNRETAQYVYKLISMKEIIENPSKYGYEEDVSLLASLDHGSIPRSASMHNPVIALSALKD